jgi:hypothetical protein
MQADRAPARQLKLKACVKRAVFLTQSRYVEPCSSGTPCDDIHRMNKKEETATPITCPTLLIVTVIPEATPSFSRGTEPKMALLFGELKRAHPVPARPRGSTILRGVAWVVRVPIANCAAATIEAPTVQRSLEPSLSESHPATGATRTIMTEFVMVMIATLDGEK